MAKTTNKDSYINVEILWANTQLESWKTYVDAHPLHTMTDRIEWKPTARGGLIPMVIASIEQQGKFIQETMKNYLALLEVVDRLREREDAKIETRGKTELSSIADDFVKRRR
jgi:hypothetical protein